MLAVSIRLNLTPIMILGKELLFWRRETGSFEVRHTLSNKWVDGVYKILDHPATDIPVYIV